MAQGGTIGTIRIELDDRIVMHQLEKLEQQRDQASQERDEARAERDELQSQLVKASAAFDELLDTLAGVGP